MTHIHRWSQKPAGQVLLATLLFCFIFITLFIGLFKSGLLFSAKERAIQAANLTALSAGAVYANGMQVVRLSNAIVFAIALGSVALLATGIGSVLEISSLLLGFNPFDVVKAAQNVQKLLFGIDEPSGLYPLLIFTETLSLTSQNGLKNTWPSLAPSTWQTPISVPSPLMLFNVASIGPETLKAVVPNMALKFRDGSFLAVPKIPKLYQMNDQGKIRIYTENQVEPAKNSRGATYWVKAGYVGAHRYVSEIKNAATDKANKIATIFSTLSAMKLDVIDRDAPPLHNIFFYAAYPTTAKDPNGKNAEIQTLSQVMVTGSGLEFWKVSDPPYITTLASTDPIELVKQSGFTSFMQNLLQGGNLQNLQDLFKEAPGGII